MGRRREGRQAEGQDGGRGLAYFPGRVIKDSKWEAVRGRGKPRREAGSPVEAEVQNTLSSGTSVAWNYQRNLVRCSCISHSLTEAYCNVVFQRTELRPILAYESV